MGSEAEATLQRSEWENASRHIKQILAEATLLNLRSTAIPRLFDVNLVVYRGLLAKHAVELAVENADRASLLSCILSVVNTKIPDVGLFVLRRAAKEYKEWRKQSRPSDFRKRICVLIAHLCNQGVCGELLPLEVLLDMLLGDKKPIECFVVAAELIRYTGAHLSSRPALKEALDSVFDRFQELMRERKDLPQGLVRQLEDLQNLRDKKFGAFPPIDFGLDLVVESARITHETSLEDDEKTDLELRGEFVLEERFIEKSRTWLALRQEYLDSVFESAEIGRDDEESVENDDHSGAILVDEAVLTSLSAPSSSSAGQLLSSTAQGRQLPKSMTFNDQTSQDVVAIRKRIYLTLNHGLIHEQVAHELLSQRSRELKGQDHEVVAMIVESCAQAKAYTDFIGRLSTRLCRAVPEFALLFEAEFKRQYDGIHRLETNKLRNIAVLFAQLMYSNCLDWPSVFEPVVLDESTTTSASRIFLKILFQKLAQLMGIDGLKAKLIPLSEFKGLFPPKPRKRTTFAVNFFTSIELGALTVEMRDWLKYGAPAEAESSTSSSSSSSSPSSSSDSESSSSSESEEDRKRRSKKSSRRKHKSSKRRKKSTKSSKRRRHDSSSSQDED